ncbi:MAG: hypothetical protein Q9219_000217 [cf. Caloplaca sp. 3 TL-2023]
MAPMLNGSPRSSNIRPRSSRKQIPVNHNTQSLLSVEPPRKKRKYVPGGPGGGGRYVDPDGSEVPVGGTGPGGYSHIGARSRTGGENVTIDMAPTAHDRPRRESRRERPSARPRFSSAAAAAAAVAQGDGFKPREERGWEEFHQDLDIEARFPIFRADEVDGVAKPVATPSPAAMLQNGFTMEPTDNPREGSQHRDNLESIHYEVTPSKNGGPDGTARAIQSLESTPRRRGRPVRRADSMLKGIGTPDIPKIVPVPGPNPREKLTLPKPSFHPSDPFLKYEQKGAGLLNYVDRSMANVGYQESDIYIRPDKMLIRVTEGNIEEDLDAAPGNRSEGEGNAAIGGSGVGTVEYDMDEQDTKWLEVHNAQRKAEEVEPIKPAIFEITMTKIEKEWHALEKRIPKPNPKPPQTHRPRSSSAAAVNGEPTAPGEEQDSKCAICDDGDCENTNAIVFCDGCDLAVHQECYGVPFIPEGQWLCRKCQLIGRGTPTCIFCPNTDGAFKQTNASRWSHLLCAIWIPEVSLGNTTFMEPVMDVEKVPKPRWKLTCYICRQKMGACIQCGNKNCFVAFHVTCAKRAKLFLKMKSTHGGPANLDASVLKAFCDKHVPADWRRENDVEAATADAIEYYHYTMRGRLWADSQQAALAMNANHSQRTPGPDPDLDTTNPKVSLILNPPGKRKRTTPPKTVWRLPSGAPVIPQVLYDSVESSLGRFAIRRRKEFAAEACKYWTLKREARRGASLLKRLQLQMETFTSMEITRRNFAGMGAAGKVRLQRRIDFAERLQQDIERLKALCDEIRKREQQKLQDAEMLRDIVDTVYFPIAPLLWPVMEKAQALDGKKVFHAGFSVLRNRLQERYYTSVTAFSADFGTVFSETIGLPVAANNAEIEARVAGDAAAKELTLEFKNKKALAKRIIKAVQGALEDAMRKESEISGRPFEKELRDLDLLLENSMRSRRDSIVEPHGEVIGEPDGRGTGSPMDTANITNGLTESHTFQDFDTGSKRPWVANYHLTPEEPNGANTNGVTNNEHLANGMGEEPVEQVNFKNGGPPTPPLSSSGQSQPLCGGGIPWYIEPFDPEGTTIQEERWTGRDLVRGMSEELSDMDEAELSGLVGNEIVDADSIEQQDASALEKAAKAAARKKAAARRRRNHLVNVQPGTEESETIDEPIECGTPAAVVYKSEKWHQAPARG